MLETLAQSLLRELVYLWYYFSIQFKQIFIYWILGMAIGSLVSVFGKEKINSLFDSLREKKLGVLGIIPASLLGIASPLCMYGTIPIAASFAEKGMEEDWIAAFMMSSILLNPQLLFYSAALGWPVLIVRFATCFACGILAGILVRFFFKKKSFFAFGVFASGASRDTDPNMLLRLAKNFGRNVKATGLYFAVGIALSALFQRYVPQEACAALFGGNRGFGVLMAATVGVPLYVCGGGTIPLLQSWMNSGMSVGQAASFMVAGPAMKITNLGALKIVVGTKHFLFYLAFSLLFALICGLIVDFL
ncbi:MAG: permease [Treponema sp.]|jgi:uncharacterized membrane protein YraQ (UPF0718 family)|nr:permease [Treponema sp.]